MIREAETRAGDPALKAPPADHHDHYQHKADPELPVLRRQRRDPVLQKLIDHRANQSAVQITGAADDQHKQEVCRAID